MFRASFYSIRDHDDGLEHSPALKRYTKDRCADIAYVSQTGEGVCPMIVIVDIPKGGP